jgi:hypothetical protein
MEDKLPRVIKPLRPNPKVRERAGDKPATRPSASPARVKASRDSSPTAKSNGQKRSKPHKRKGK